MLLDEMCGAEHTICSCLVSLSGNICSKSRPGESVNLVFIMNARGWLSMLGLVARSFGLLASEHHLYVNTIMRHTCAIVMWS